MSPFAPGVAPVTVPLTVVAPVPLSPLKNSSLSFAGEVIDDAVIAACAGAASHSAASRQTRSGRGLIPIPGAQRTAASWRGQQPYPSVHGHSSAHERHETLGAGDVRADAGA